jgi:coenzyme F420 biosynthesis associated uncharacterized protein
MVDWDLAVATARRLAKPGPTVTAEEARVVVTELKAFATVATGPVRAYTGLDSPAEAAPVVVVDRGGWAQANADGMRQIIAPLIDKLRQRRSGGSGLFDQVGPKVTGVETGALLAFLSGKVLGQFDPFWSDGNGAAGRLLLVAPNVVHVERELKVEPRDFRMWVCLHEETHRVQFTAVPWLRDHLRAEIESFVGATEVDPSVLVSRLREVVKSVIESAQGGEDGPSVLDLVQSPAQKAVIDRVTAVMSLLEGHADVVMDGVGGRPERGDDPRAVPAPTRRCGQPGPDGAPAARAGGQDAPVPRRRQVHPGGRRQGRHGWLQPGLGLGRDVAHSRRDRRPGGVDPPGPWPGGSRRPVSMSTSPPNSVARPT